MDIYIPHSGVRHPRFSPYLEHIQVRKLVQWQGLRLDCSAYTGLDCLMIELPYETYATGGVHPGFLS